MPRVEFNPSRRRFFGDMLTAVGLLTAGVGVADMVVPLDDPQKKGVSPLTITKEDFLETLKARDACRRAVVDPNSQTCLKAEQDVGRELEAQVAFRGRLRQEQLSRDTAFLLVGAVAGLIGVKISR